MAGGESLGNLYFDLGLDDKEFVKKLDAIKKNDFKIKIGIDSSELTNIKSLLSSISSSGIKSSGSGTLLQQAKAQAALNESAAKVEGIQEKNKGATIANANAMQKLAVATTNAAIAQEKLNAATNATAASSAKANAAAQRELAKAISDSAIAQERLNAAEKTTANKVASGASKAAIDQQRLNKEIENAALAHKRNENFGVQSQSRIRSNAEFTNKTLLSQRQIAMQLSNQFGTMFSIYAVERFVKKLAEVRGEFELQKVSLRSVLQDAPAADAIFEKVKSLSLTSPFTFKELSGYTKQLSAMSIPAKDLFDTMKKLADVSAGVGVGMDRIVLAYGQVKAAGVLRGQELRQFSEAGINIVELLANKFTKLKGQVVTSADVFDMISKKMVSFGMVSEIFDDMTSAGGKFYKMQEIQAATLSGMISNLTDAYELGLNTIGESNDAILKGTVQIMTLLARNMEAVAKIALAIAAAYGTYRAVLITSNILQAINAKIAYQQALANIGNTGATIKLTTAQGLQAVVTSKLTGIQVALNRAMIANPIVAASLAILALAGFMTMYANSAEKAVNYTEEFASINKEAEKSTKAEINTLESLRKTLNYSTSSYKEKKYALTELQRIVPAYHASLTKEGELINNNTKALDDYASKLVATEKIKIAAQKQAMAEEEFSSYASSTKDVLSEALRKRAEASASGKYDNPDDVLMAGERAALATWTRLAKNVGVYSDAIEALRKELMQVGSSTPAVLGGGGTGGEKTDYVAKNLENQIKLVKNLYSEYSKLKGVQGSDLAKGVILSDSDYASSRSALSAFGVSPTFSEDAMNAEISKLILRTEQTKKVKEIGAAFASGMDKGFADKKNEAFRNIFKSIEQTISDYKPKYDLYEKLLGLTGDRKKSSQLAFGKDAVDDYETFLRTQYAKMPGASFFSELTPPAEGATEEVKKAWKDLVEYIQSKKLGKIEYFEQMISEAASASDKIKKIELDRERDIADAEKAYATDPERKKIAIDAAKSKADGQINEIRSTLFQLTPLYDEVFKDLGKVAIGNLDDLLGKTKGLVNILRDENKTEVKKDASGRITGYFVKKDTVDPNTGLKIEKDTLVSVEKYNELLERTNTIVNKINENPFKALFNPAKGDAAETTEERLARIGKGIAGLSELAQSVSGDLGGIMDSFGASAESQAALKNITDVATGTASIASGILSGDPVQAIKGVVGGIGKIIGGLTAIHDAKYEKQIKAYQKQIDATAKSYDKLTESLSRKTEASKVDAQAEEYNLLQREKSLLEAQKRAEEAKKKTDQSKIDDYNKQIEEATNKQQELALNTINYVLGGSIGAQSDSWAKTLTDAMDTAFQNGTDAAKAWGDSVDTIVRDIAKNFIVNSFLGNQLQDWLEAASTDWTDANKNINQSAIEADLQGFSLFAKSLEPATEAALKALNSIYGDGKTGTSGTGLTGEIKGVTEDTAQRLASLLNAIRQDSGVNRLAFAEMKNILSEFNRGSIEANSYLNKINENTRLTAENTAAIVRAFHDVTGVGSQGKALRVL